jgi:hypothetical protein
VYNIVSNDVYEYELEQVNSKIAALNAKKQKIPEDLENRKQLLQIGLNVLQTKVQAEQLSEEDYLKIMESKIAEEKTLAKALLDSGKKEWALMALNRVKIMKGEIEAMKQ